MVPVTPGRRILPTLLLGLVFLSGCCFGSDVPEDTSMHVSTEFRDMHRCTRISPEIVVANPPKGVALYSIRLDRVADDGAVRYLGGGAWKFDGKVDEEGLDYIPEGALTQNYRGPCEEGRYRLTVSALPNGSNRPLAVSSDTFRVK